MRRQQFLLKILLCKPFSNQASGLPGLLQKAYFQEQVGTQASKLVGLLSWLRGEEEAALVDEIQTTP